MSDDITIRNAQSTVHEWITKFGVRYFSELTNMAILTEEVGEVARIIARKYGDQSSKASEPDCYLADELADVVIYALEFANITGLDVATAITAKMAANAQASSML